MKMRLTVIPLRHLMLMSAIVVTLSATTIPSWLSFNAGTGVLSGTPGNSDVGAHSVVLKATDTNGAVSQQSFTVTVANVNDAPVITTSEVTSVNEDASYSYTFAASDVDVGDSVTISKPTIPSWLSFNAGTGVLSGTPGNSDVGAHSVVLKATDTNGAVSQQSFTVTVANVNDAPVITTSEVTSVNEDASYSYTFAASDVDVGDSVTLSATTIPSWLSFNAGTGVLSGTPGNSDVGAHSVVLKATDTNGAVSQQSFTVTVANVNDAPTVSGQLSMDIKVSNNNSGTFLIERFPGKLVNLSQADALIAGGNATDSANRATINMRDSGGGVGRFGSSDAFPGGSTSGNLDNFAIKATGNFSVGSSGTFTIFTHTDDGHRVKVDGTTILTDDRNHGNEDFFTPISLSAGSHTLEIVYWEAGGGATLEVGIGSGNIASFNSSTIQLLSSAAQAVDLNLLSGVVDPDGDIISVSNFSLSSGDGSGISESSGSLQANFGSLSSSQNATFTFDVTDGSGGSVSQTLGVGVFPSGDANDTVDFSASGTRIELGIPLDGIEIVTGSPFDDTLLGGEGDQTISGGSGNDTIAGGAGFDTLNGGDGNDIFQIRAESDVTSGTKFIGGSGDDSIVLTSTSISSLTFPLSPDSVLDVETLDVSGGSNSGVIISIDGADLISVNTIIGDGSSDQLNFTKGDYTLSSGKKIDEIETIKFSQNNTPQDITINGTITGVTLFEGTVNSIGVADEDLIFSGSLDLSGVALTNIDELTFDGASIRQSLSVNVNSNLGLAKIEGFVGGSSSATDQFDYKSDLVSGDGTSVSASSDFTLTEIDSSARATNVISTNSSGVIDFETTVNTNNLGIDITNSSLSQITTAVEALLESTDASINLTGSSAQMTQGAANTDSLLIFYDNDEDAAIIRYQEGATSEADFSGELSVLAIFDNITGVSTFDNANIV